MLPLLPPTVAVRPRTAQSDVPLGLGTLMALLLAFRLNVSYSRWWEGRLLWGSAALASRSTVTAILAQSDTRAKRWEATPWDPSRTFW